MKVVTKNHNQIKEWVEKNNGKPVLLLKDGENKLDLIFPQDKESFNYRKNKTTWDNFFREFERNNLALMFDWNRGKKDKSYKFLYRFSMEEVSMKGGEKTCRTKVIRAQL